MSWLLRFAWFRRWRGGEWARIGGRWVRLEVTDSAYTDLSDNFCLREELQTFLKRCDEENQRERT